jgi:hypothetical protein
LHIVSVVIGSICRPRRDRLAGRSGKDRMKRLFCLPVFLLVVVVGTAAPAPMPTPFEGPAVTHPQNRIDELVFGRLETLGIQPARLCTDAVFIRRVYLDVIGTLPTAQDVRDFLADQDPAKRAKLIDRVLQRDEFADYWALKWSDLLRVKSEFPINLWPNAVQAYHRWIHTSIFDNVPYDRFVQEMLKSSGSNFRVGQVNFYRAMQGNDPTTIAKTVALTFMGTRAETWPAERLAGMAAFFSQLGFKSTAEWKEQIVFFDPSKGAPPAKDQAPATGPAKPGAAAKPAAPAVPVFPDGTPARIAPDQDPREVFADWLTTPQNPWFARAIANRIWSWLLGRGIVQEPDDIRPDNPPVNPELLAWLEHELVKAHFDLKHLYRVILNSQTYQLSCIPRTENPAGAANFAYYPLRRIDAEVLIDAICQITGTHEKYSSPIPEPFTFIPEEQRSIALADGSITSSFLEMFNRPARDTGLESERNNRPSPDQRLHLLNSTHILSKINQSPMLRPLRLSKTPGDNVREVYLTVISRPPTPAEMQAVQNYAQTGPVKGRDVLVDLTWALMNSAEFLYRH